MRVTARELVAAAEAQVASIPVAEAAALQGRDDVRLIDLRDRREQEREGRIPGALHCPRGMLEFWIDPESPYHQPVFGEAKRFVFYCAMGWRSALATKTAQDMGLTDVAHVTGGFTTWKDAGLPVEEVAPKR